LKFLKIQLDTDLETILTNYQNNYVGCSNCLLEYPSFLLIMLKFPPFYDPI